MLLAPSGVAPTRRPGDDRGVQGHSERVEAAIARLRGAGERLTPGRRAVIEVLDVDSRHLDADAIAALVAQREPGVHRATIYRSLQALVDGGVVRHTHVPGGATIYHLVPAEHLVAETEGRDEVRARRHGHAHVQCVRCERFTDIDAHEFAPLVARIREISGFVVDAEHAALLGVCAECAAERSGTNG